jgi:hypothetical protein
MIRFCRLAHMVSNFQRNESSLHGISKKPLGLRFLLLLYAVA